MIAAAAQLFRQKGYAATSTRDQLRALIRHPFEVLLGPGSDFIPVMLYEWRSLNALQRQTITQIKDDDEAALGLFTGSPSASPPRGRG